MTTRQIYDRFKQLCPNSPDEYTTHPQAVKRWEWHILQAEKVEQYEAVQPPAHVVDFFAKRAVNDWADLPEIARRKFDIVKCYYPEHDVYAAGSYVNGDYITPFCPQFVKQYRGAIGKTKAESDFDYFTNAPLNPKAPDWSDKIRYVPGDKMILVPMWDFEKIPAHQRARIGNLIATNQWAELAQENNRYGVSTYPVCCDLNPMKNYYMSKYATGFFTNGETQAKGKR